MLSNMPKITQLATAKLELNGIIYVKCLTCRLSIKVSPMSFPYPEPHTF